MHALIHPLEGSNLPPVCCAVAMEKKANTKTHQSTGTPLPCQQTRSERKVVRRRLDEKQQAADE